MSKKKDLAKIALGASLGVGVGFLFAPKSGKETRNDLKVKIDKFGEKVKTLKEQGLRNEFSKKSKS